MDELLFTGMDVPNEVQSILDITTDNVCAGMTDSERKAYDCGVANALSVLRALLESDGGLIVHIPGHDAMEEMDIAELEEIFLG